MATETESMPQLEVIDKLRQIPMVQSACCTSVGVYQKVKGYNELFSNALGTAEGAAALAMTAVAPVANKLQGPIKYVDSTLCKGIDVLQEKVPLVKEPPQQIVDNAKTYVTSSAATGVAKVQNITNAGWEKANEVLTTTTVGNITLSGLDKTSFYADLVIDYVLPASGDEENIHPHPSSECDDKVAHAAHTVGELSYKVGSRIYNSINRRRSLRRSDSQSSEASVHSSDEEEEKKEEGEKKK